jgi:predicted nucleic acid-binding protein
VKAALLDINILTALLWPTHEHHDVAHRWFGGRADARWATCSLTQLGFVRIVSNPAFSPDALSPMEALALLAENLVHPAHEFWADSLQVPPAVKGMESVARSALRRRRLLRRNPKLYIVRIPDVGSLVPMTPQFYNGPPTRGRVTHDISTLAKHAFDRIAAGQPMPGVLEVRSVTPIGT